MEQYIVTGMSCAACQARVEKAVSQVPGVSSCSVSLLTNSMGVEGNASPSDIIKAVENAGYGASIKGADNKKVSASERLAAEEEALKDRETPILKRRLILSVVFLCALMYITMGHNMWGWPLPEFFEHNHIGLGIVQMLLAIIVMLINNKFFTSGFKSLMHGAPNMDTLIALGSGVSFLWSVYVLLQMTYRISNGTANMDLMPLYHDQLYFESAAMILAFITIGKMLEAMSKGRTTDALKGLMKLAPKTAVLLRAGEEVEVSIDEVASGDTFIVKPGENIPVDGIILEGSSAINEAALTGESIPVDKQPGDIVSAATINTSGYLRCQATRVGEDTTLSQIIKMVSDAAATKAPIAKIADKVSGIFVPAVIAIALLTIIGWLLAGADFATALERGISVLVISCPCALGLATPVAIMVGNGMAAKNGILFKTSQSLEQAGKMAIIALDKTGTITSGEPKVTDIIPAEGIREEELLSYANALEAKSEHPLAKAITALAEERKMDTEEVSEFEALPGNGLKAKYSASMLYGGSQKYIKTLVSLDQETIKRSEALSDQGKTPLFFVKDKTLLGIIAVADVIKKDSPEAIRQLQDMGIEVVMLTGDNEKTAKTIGKIAGVNRVIAGVLPDGKEAIIRDLQQYGPTAMVGDGINDAPALTRADIGIAIGAGTDVAIDSADIVLMNSKLLDVAAAIRLSRATLRSIHQNLFWAFFYNLILIPVAAGLTPLKINPMMGAAAMSLSSFTVCINALRLNLFNLHDSRRDHPLKKAVHLPEVQADDAGSDLNEETIRIEGMMCEHCERRIEKALGKLEGIKDVKADHLNGTAIITYTALPDEQSIRKAIEDEDYTYIGIGIKEEKHDMEKTLKVEGMMCQHCEATVKKALEAIDGVEEACADHEKGIAQVRLSKEVDDEVLKKAVEDKEYKVTGIE